MAAYVNGLLMIHGFTHVHVGPLIHSAGWGSLPLQLLFLHWLRYWFTPSKCLELLSDKFKGST